MLCTPQKRHCEILLISKQFFVILRMIRGCGWALLGYLRPRVAALAGRWPWPWRALPACEPAPIVALIRQSPTVQNHYVGGRKGPWQVLCIIKSSFRIWKCMMHVTIFAPHHTFFSWILEDLLRENIKRKKTFSLGHCPNHLTPPLPLTPIRATWSSFLDVKNDVLRVWPKFFWWW